MKQAHGYAIGLAVATLALAFVAAGCGGSAGPPAGAPPATAPPSASAPPAGGPAGTEPQTRIINPAIGGAPNEGPISSGWRYRFQMTSPANDRNAITERWVYLYFWPDTTRVWFQMENRAGDPIKILWDECRFVDTDGRVSKVLHEGVPYDRRNEPQDYQNVGALERYSDWLAPVDLMNDPSAAQGRGMRLLFPTDNSAQSYLGKTFGVTFVLDLGGIPKTYNLAFKVQSVIPPR